MNNTKELPILFSTPMVQDLLAGRKTQTRRVIKFKDNNEYHNVREDRTIDGIAHFYVPYKNDEIITCRYGKPGDILWVRENWRLHSWDFEDGECTVEFPTGELHTFELNDDTKEQSVWLANQIDSLEAKGIFEMKVRESGNEDDIVFKRTDKPMPWKPSIHMPKEAARIWLKVKSIRVERLQDISDEDARAEGIHNPPIGHIPTAKKMGTHRYGFANLWSDINGKESWDINPWVWVVEFEVLSTTGKPDNI